MRDRETVWVWVGSSKEEKCIFPPKRKWCWPVPAASGNPTLKHVSILLPFDTFFFFSPFEFHMYFFISLTPTSFSLPLYPTDWCLSVFLTNKRQFVFRLIQLIDLLVCYIETSLCRESHLLEVKEAFFSYLALAAAQTDILYMCEHLKFSLRISLAFTQRHIHSSSGNHRLFAPKSRKLYCV